MFQNLLEEKSIFLHSQGKCRLKRASTHTEQVAEVPKQNIFYKQNNQERKFIQASWPGQLVSL